MCKVNRSKLYWAAISILGVFFMTLPLLSVDRDASSATIPTVDQCEKASGLDGIASIRNACKSCINGGPGTTSRAAMWISTDPKGEDDVIKVKKIKLSPGETLKSHLKKLKDKDRKISAKIWGKSYSCTTSFRQTVYGYSIWFAPSKVEWDTNKKYDFIEFLDGDNTLYRGEAYGQQYTWTSVKTGGVNAKKITIDLGKFIEQDGVECQGELNSSNTVQTCKLKISINRCFRPGGYNKNNGCGGDDSTIKIRFEVEEEEKEIELSTDGDVYGVSAIKIDKQGDDISQHDWEESDYSGTVTMKLSTRQPEVEVNFRHELYWSGASAIQQASMDALRESGAMDNYILGGAVEFAEGVKEGICIDWSIKKMDTPNIPPTSADYVDYLGDMLCPFKFDKQIEDAKEALGDAENDSELESAKEHLKELEAEASKMSIESPGPRAQGNKKIKDENTVKVKLEPGQRRTVCQKQSFRPASFSFTISLQPTGKMSYGKEIVKAVITGIQTKTSGTIIVDGEEVESKISEWSKACAVIYRPLEPPFIQDGEYEGFEGATTNSDTDTAITYAGESLSFYWKAQGWNWNTHRIGVIQPVLLLIPVTQKYEEGVVDGTNYYKTGATESDTCTFWSTKIVGAPPGSCKVYDEVEAIDHSQPDKDNRDMHEWRDKEPDAQYIQSLNAAVPDDVGAKYCNSIGYKFEYWFAINRKSDDEKGDVDIMQDEWTHESQFDYWAVLDADCRTIAKKPTSAVWNTGMSTPGGIKTSLANRYTTPQFGVPDSASENGRLKLYGSWAEYITAANRQIFGMGSGASLWKSDGGGSNYLSLCNPTNTLEGNTPLTLASGSLTESLGSTKLKPCEALGKAGISEDSNFLGRVYTYLDSNRLNAIGSKNNIKILQGGEITENVIAGVNPPYASGSGIYGIPQTIILATGSELKISENVTKIDAWIIAPNATINTCSEFKKKETQAEVLTPTLGIGKRYVPYTDNDGDVHCNKQLVFNGPVIAGGLELNRQYGADAHMMIGEEEDADGRNRPAEVFNLRADAYIWAYAQAQRYGSSFTESYSRELAPRY